MALDSNWLCPAQTAVVVVDIQNDFIDPNGAYGRAGLMADSVSRAVEHIQWLLGAVRDSPVTVVLTRFITSARRPWPSSPSRNAAVGWDRVCQPGSWGAQHPQWLLEYAAERPVLAISKRGYSAFHNTSLGRELRRAGVRNLILTGVSTNGCVDSTVRDAFERRFEICVASDCVAGYEKRLGDAALANFRTLFGLVAPAARLVTALEGIPAIAEGSRESLSWRVDT